MPKVVVGRYYDPSTGQFLSVDPLVDGTGEPYVYAQDNPVNDADPTGDIGLPTRGQVIGVVSGGIEVVHGVFGVGPRLPDLTDEPPNDKGTPTVPVGPPAAGVSGGGAGGGEIEITVDGIEIIIDVEDGTVIVSPEPGQGPGDQDRAGQSADDQEETGQPGSDDEASTGSDSASDYSRGLPDQFFGRAFGEGVALTSFSTNRSSDQCPFGSLV